MLFEIQKFSFKKMHFNVWACNMAAILSRPQCVNRVDQKIVKCIQNIGFLVCVSQIDNSDSLHIKRAL